MNAAERAEALGAVPLFAGLSKAALRRLARVASEVEVPAGQILIEPGAKGAGMFVLLEGTVGVQARGRRRVLGPGEVFGELALLRPDAERTARVQAKTPARCLAIEADDFRRLLLDEPRMAVALLETVASRLS